MIRRYLLDTGIAQDFQEDRNGVRDLAIAERKIDMQIGAIARTLPHCTVVSKDADLLAISGLTVENWAT